MPLIVKSIESILVAHLYIRIQFSFSQPGGFRKHPEVLPQSLVVIELEIFDIGFS